jgi:hypothetical protein
MILKAKCDLCGKILDKAKYPKLDVALTRDGKTLCKDCAEIIPYENILKWC